MPSKADVFEQAAPLIAAAVKEVRESPYRAVPSGFIENRWVVMNDLDGELVHRRGGGVRFFDSADDATAAANRMNRDHRKVSSSLHSHDAKGTAGAASPGSAPAAIDRGVA